MAEYRGVVTVNGRPVEIQVEGSSASRTLVHADGQVVLNEKPFIAKEQYVFRVGARELTLKWVPAGFASQCHIVADDTVVLKSVDRTGAARQPLASEEVARRNARAIGVLLILGGLACLAINSGIREGEVYYPKLLALAPLLILGGAIAAIAPAVALRLKAAKGAAGIAAGVAAAAAMILSWLLFVPFYLRLFAR